jgi:hypothetical protein
LPKWWAAGECSVKEKGRAATSLSLAEEGRSGSVVGGSSLFFFLPKKEEGAAARLFRKKKGAMAKEMESLWSAEEGRPIDQGEEEDGSICKQGVGCFLSRSVYL